MRKTLFMLFLLLLGGLITVKAQTEKSPPPPPPKPGTEILKPPPPNKVDIIEKTPPVISIKGKQADEFYKRNPMVTEISRQGSLIRLKMENETTEKYNMSNKEEKKKFIDKYGKEPIPDPPPPPPKKRSDIMERLLKTAH